MCPYLCTNTDEEKKLETQRENKKEQQRMKVRKIVQKLKPDAKDYNKKLKLLSELMETPDTGHIIHRDIVDWCRRHGLKPRANHEDRYDWWTCSARE